MINSWKVPHIAKGLLTYVPALNALRVRRAATGGSNSPRYCYAVWMRHLVTLAACGVTVKDAAVGELGPGDTTATGLAALLSGARTYVGLDAISYPGNANLDMMLEELARLFLRREPIPDHREFPRVRPRLDSYDFPAGLIDTRMLDAKIRVLRGALKEGATNGDVISYRAPWTSVFDVAPGSLDVIFSQAVLQYVDDLEKAYQAMFTWLKPGGTCSHATGLGANNFSPYWNGHWAYTDREWRMVRGRREFLLNRATLSTHIAYARRAGFQVVLHSREYATDGLPIAALSRRFQEHDEEDLRTRGVVMILHRPK
jgi:SAM-dependent methyltransferase